MYMQECTYVSNRKFIRFVWNKIKETETYSPLLENVLMNDSGGNGGGGNGVGSNANDIMWCRRKVYKVSLVYLQSLMRRRIIIEQAKQMASDCSVHPGCHRLLSCAIFKGLCETRWYQFPSMGAAISQTNSNEDVPRQNEWSAQTLIANAHKMKIYFFIITCDDAFNIHQIDTQQIRICLK